MKQGWGHAKYIHHDKPFLLIDAKGLHPGVCSRACCVQACVLALASVCAFCLCCEHGENIKHIKTHSGLKK